MVLSCGDCSPCPTEAERLVNAKPTEPGLRNSNGGEVTGASSPSCPSPGFSMPPETIGDLNRKC